MRKNDLVFASIMMFIAVLLGAFGAHGLKENLSPEQIQSFQTGVRYQMIHSIVILIFASKSFSWLKNRGLSLGLMKLGMILFSFSIYGLAYCNYSDNLSAKSFLGPITPIGGLLMIVSWLLIIISMLKSTDE